MIQANELRVGNYVNRLMGTDCGYHRVRTKVNTISDCDINTGQMNYGMLSEIESIPLTPEILEACGFKRKTSSNRIQFVNDKMFGYLMPYGNGEYVLWDLEDQFITDETLRLTCLHQLQNLYFALTGDELMIDEQKLQRNVATTAK